MKHKYFSALFTIGAFSLTLLSGCSDSKDEPTPAQGPKKKTILLYAVASNNLYPNLLNDKREIIMGVRDNNIDLNNNTVMVYEVIPNNQELGDTPRLLELVHLGGNEYEYKEVKRYDRSVYSTDPQRISEVIGDVKEFKPSDTYGLILWSHSLGWSPFFSERDSHAAAPAIQSKADDMWTATEAISRLPINHSFGYDTNTETGYTDKTDIDELADAIPDGMFEFIWIDACMMTCIETIYELRDKCQYFGGYPTEVYSPGMPYELTIPYLLQEKADMVGCAKEFFNYYANNPATYLRTATVAVVDMSVLPEMASFCKEAYQGKGVPSTAGMDYYSGNQRVAYKFYDFGQYSTAKIRLGGDTEEEKEFKKVLDRLVIYKAATEKEFTNRTLNLEEYSGLSSHVYDPAQTGSAIDFYKNLDWFKAVY